ncbi:ATP/GTP-binding protein [Streptomyces sp. NBC_00510]
MDTLQNVEVPCHLKDLGWWSPNCYYQLADPQPPAGDPAWESHKPGDGAVYEAYCPDEGPPIQWLQNPPPGMGGGVDPARLAQEAVRKLPIEGPDIGIAPAPDSKGGTIGVPVWLWNTKGQATAGPSSASATAGAITVTATAHVSKIVWRLGDGGTVVCSAGGTPYKASYGLRKSPDCGYVYGSTSAWQPHGKYTVTATSTWQVHWVGGGQQGDLTTTRTSQVQIRIGELQVVGGQ